MVLFYCLEALFTILLSYSMKELIDAPGLASSGGGWTDMITPELWHFITISALALLSSMLAEISDASWGTYMRAQVSGSLFRYLSQHAPAFFSERFSGGITNLVNEATTGTTYSLNNFAVKILPILTTITVTFWLFYIAHKGLAAFLLFWAMLYITVMLWLSWRAFKLARAYTAQRSTVTGKIVDAISNIQSVILFNRHQQENENLKGALRLQITKARRLYYYTWCLRQSQRAANLGLLVVVIVVAFSGMQKGEISTGEFAMLFSLTLLLITKVQDLSTTFIDQFEYLGNVQEGLTSIVRPYQITAKADALPLKVTKGEVVFDDVSFSYEDGNQVFDGLNLHISAGERVGLVGESGAGKSTLVSLLLRMYDPQAGYIRIDGQTIAGTTLGSLRQQIAVIPQDTQLFNRSLLENIRYGRPDATDAEVIQAAKKAYCDGFVSVLPHGYETLVGERGVKLSGGQRQRVAIARAILKDAPILVLDEATASLDSVSEAYIQKSLGLLMQGRTVIVIAHRLSTLRNMDRVIVLKEGEVAEEGSHQSLKHRKDGIYAKLWHMQVDGFLT